MAADGRRRDLRPRDRRVHADRLDEGPPGRPQPHPARRRARARCGRDERRRGSRLRRDLRPATGTFAPTGSLTTERVTHSATLLADGSVLVTGGSNRYGEPRTAELYDRRPAGSSGPGRRSAGICSPCRSAMAGCWSSARPRRRSGHRSRPSRPRNPAPCRARASASPSPRSPTARPHRDPPGGRPRARRRGHAQDLSDGNPPDVLRSARSSTRPPAASPRWAT